MYCPFGQVYYNIVRGFYQEEFSRKICPIRRNTSNYVKKENRVLPDFLYFACVDVDSVLIRIALFGGVVVQPCVFLHKCANVAPCCITVQPVDGKPAVIRQRSYYSNIAYKDNIAVVEVFGVRLCIRHCGQFFDSHRKNPFVMYSVISLP